MKYELYMECRGGNKHALRTLLIIKLKDGSFRLQQQCLNCKSFKYPHWGSNGKILGSATYKHHAVYREFLNNHDPVQARLEILASNLKKVEAPSDGNVGVNLRQTKGHSPRKVRTAAKSLKRRRPRDKRRPGP